MSDDLETAIARTLSTAAHRAPGLPPDVLHRVELRDRRRHRRRVAIAGLAVLVVAAGSVAAVRGLTGDLRPSGPASKAAATPDATKVPPLATVWPQAVHTVAAKLSDGRGYQPITLIDENWLLVSTQASFENRNELWALHLTSREERRVARIPAPRPRTAIFASHFTVGSGHVVWWTSYTKDGKQYTDIWKAPVGGGDATLVTTASGVFGTTYLDGDRLAVANDTVYWSRSSHNSGEHAVWRVPLAGGEPEKVPGTEGHYIISLPWVGKPGDREARGCQPVRACESDPATLWLYRELRNIDTGERRSAETSGMPKAVCGVTYCLELDPEQSGAGSKVRHRDGSGVRVLPGVIGVGAPPGTTLPGLDRFVVLRTTGKRALLYDLRTGRGADLGPITGTAPPNTRLPEDRLVHWPGKDGKTYVVVDLAAIR